MRETRWKKKVFYDFALSSAVPADRFVSDDASSSKTYIQRWKDHDLEALGIDPKECVMVKITVERLK